MTRGSVHATRAQATKEAIRQMILDGEIKWGARLGAQALADRLGVSRTPVFEALAALHKEGLLDYEAHRGYGVKAFNIDDFLGAIDVRIVLEGLACRLITERGMSDAAAGAIGANLARSQAMLFGQWSEAKQQEWRLLNLEFHDLLLREVNNKHLEQGVISARALPLVLNGNDRRIEQRDLFPMLDQEFNQQAFRDHARIFEAMQAGQSARAENMMKEHIFSTRERARRIITELLEDAGPPAAAARRGQGASSAARRRAS